MEEAPVVIIVWNAVGSLWIGDIFYTLKALEHHFSNPWKLTAALALGWPNHNPQPYPENQSMTLPSL